MVVNERLRASIDVAPRTAAFYEHVIMAFEEEGVPFMLGGAFAFEVYTDIGGRTKDLDLFLHPRNVKAAMAALNRRGYDTEMKAEHWLAKIKSGDDFVDVIFGSGNGLARANSTACDTAASISVRIVSSSSSVASPASVRRSRSAVIASCSRVTRRSSSSR